MEAIEPGIGDRARPAQCGRAGVEGCADLPARSGIEPGVARGPLGGSRAGRMDVDESKYKPEGESACRHLHP